MVQKSNLVIFSVVVIWFLYDGTGGQLSIQFQLFSNCKQEVAHVYGHNSIANTNRKSLRARFTLLKVNIKVWITKFSLLATRNKKKKLNFRSGVVEMSS